MAHVCITTRPPRGHGACACSRRLFAISVAAFAACGAQAKLDVATERQYGGVYSNACGDRSALSLKFYDDVMMVERGGKAVTANRVQAGKTRAATAPDPDFKAVITGSVAGSSDGLSFVLHHNAQGLFATIEGGAQSLASLGSGVVGQRLRHCDPNRNALPGAPVAAGPQGPDDLLRDTRFKTAYLKALGPLAREPWLKQLDGPAQELRKLTVAGTEYTLATVCKSHDCSEHNMVVLYDPKQGAVAGLVQQRGVKTLLGNPAPALAREIDAQWAKEWRSGR